MTYTKYYETTTLSGLGYPVKIWSRIVPRIPNAILDCSIYLYPSVDHAMNGKRGGGSGFVIAIPYQEKINGIQYSHTYAVTNSHVVSDGNHVIRVNTRSGKLDTIEVQPHQWKHHEDRYDVAVALIETSVEHRVLFMLNNALLTPQKLEKFDINIGSDVVTIGRFIGHEGREQNIPVVRFGNISMMPTEPIINSYTKLPEDSFLVEARSISGFSGSVVYASNRPTNNVESAGGVLGIAWGYLPNYSPVVDRQGERLKYPDDDLELGWRVDTNSGMMAVVPAWKIIEVLEIEELIMQRKQIEEKKRKDAENEPVGIATGDNENEGRDLTREEFEKILRRVSRPTPSPSAAIARTSMIRARTA